MTLAVCPAPVVLLEQLARWWSRRSQISGGLRFCEPASATPSNLYRRALPALADRLSPAASITLAPGAAAGEPLDPTVPFVVAVTARAATVTDAMALLADCRAAVRPNLRPLADADSRNLIGAPGGDDGSAVAFTSNAACLWRVIQLDILAEAQPLNIARGDAATEEGEAEALMTLAVRALPATIYRAFDLHYDGAQPTATAAIASGSLELAANDAPLTPIDLSTHTLATLYTAINALGGGWTAADPFGAIGAAPALSLLPLTQRSVKGAANTVQLAAYTPAPGI